MYQRLHIVAPTFGAKSVLYLSISAVAIYLSMNIQHSVVDRCWGLKHCASNRGLLLEIRREGGGE